MPSNTARVDRATKWGNPFTTANAYDAFVRFALAGANNPPTASDGRYIHFQLYNALRFKLSDLRGKNLACWCKPDQSCHADVLLRVANLPIERRTSDE